MSVNDKKIRRMNIRIEIDLWKWPDGSKQNTLDVTKDILNYRFQKSIKSPEGSCQLAVLPQSADKHILDILRILDVVKIYEFEVLKFVGYITRVSYSGAIDPATGKPRRSATLTCRQIGGLLVSAKIGLGLGTALGLESDGFIDAAAKLSKSILDATVDGVTFAELITILIDSFKTYLEDIGASGFTAYLSEYLDTTTGLTSEEAPGIPRSFELFTGTESALGFWDVAEQLIQKPFNEFWIDNGPRRVSVDGNEITLPEKASLVFRATPFNGTVKNGVAGNAFDSLPLKIIPKDYLLQFDLNRSMDEVFTFYSVKQPAFQLSDIARLLLGKARVDTDRLGKYLFRPLITELFYTRVEELASEDREISQGNAEKASDDGAETLLNWFKDNEDYLTGAITHMVPSEASEDIYIGDKVAMEGIEGQFYVEGIAHVWNYQGPLKNTLTVTRGYNRQRKIQLKDRLFSRSIIQ